MAGQIENKKMQKAIDEASSSSPNSKPVTPFIPISKLIAKLSNCLPRPKICFMIMILKDFMEKKLTRHQMVFYLRKVIDDDDVIIAAIENYTQEMTKESAVANFEKLSSRKE